MQKKVSLSNARRRKHSRHKMQYSKMVEYNLAAIVSRLHLERGTRVALCVHTHTAQITTRSNATLAFLLAKYRIRRMCRKKHSLSFRVILSQVKKIRTCIDTYFEALWFWDFLNLCNLKLNLILNLMYTITFSGMKSIHRPLYIRSFLLYRKLRFVLGWTILGKNIDKMGWTQILLKRDF